MEYLAKFDDAGRRKSTVIRGVHYTTDTERKKYIGDDGYIPISDEEYQTYIGNRGTGDNGTGYIRDANTGKPVSAPPKDTEPPQEMDVQPIPETELAVMEGMVNIQTRLAAIEAKLKGGE